jgi:hypothetical protein
VFASLIAGTIMNEMQTSAADVVAASGASAVSWGAIFAGTAVAVASSLLLFALATGLDLASMSPARLAAGASFTVTAAIALIASQWISSFLGGYITGRLRTRWVGTHTHEVFFRDTAHGFITWCVATVVMASGFASAASTLTGVRVPTAGAAAYVRETPARERLSWSLRAAPELSSEKALVLPERPATAVQTDIPIPGEDLRGGLDQPSAWVSAIDPGTTDAAGPDAERKDAAAGSILTALSMLIGAFIASASGALGGRLRDLHP